MSQQSLIRGRRHHRGQTKRSHRPLSQTVAPVAASATGTAALAYPGYLETDEADKKRTLVTGSAAALLHLGGFAFLLLMASLAPVVEEVIIPVQILSEEPPPPPEAAAPAPKALAERRNLPFAPAVQAVQPQIVNPRVIAEAAPAVAADALQMDAVSASTAPTQIRHSTTTVERVSAVRTATRAQVSAVDVSSVASPVVRGPTRVDVPVGPSVGPRRVEAAAVGTTMGTAPLQIGSGNGSSVAEGVLSDRDVIGSPDGALVMSVDTSIGEGVLAGGTPGGTGTAPISRSSCMKTPAVQSYLDGVHDRMIQRWVLPPGVDAGRKVKLRFRLDVAGSATSVTIVKTEDNALGASAVDALRSAAPFPPMPEQARCLAQVPIIGTFSNPVGG